MEKSFDVTLLAESSKIIVNVGSPDDRTVLYRRESYDVARIFAENVIHSLPFNADGRSFKLTISTPENSRYGHIFIEDEETAAVSEEYEFDLVSPWWDKREDRTTTVVVDIPDVLEDEDAS